MTLSIRSLIRVLKTFRLFYIIGGLLALSLSGCSAVRLGYNNAPELSYWWLDSYLDFNGPQTHKMRADLAALQTWHRSSELPSYVSTLEKLQRVAPSNVTSAQVCELFGEVTPHFQTLVDQVEPTVVALAPTLKDEQLDHLARKLDKRSEKWREEWLEGSTAERHARRVKQLLDRAEMLYGRLEEQQLTVLRNSVAASTFDAATSYRESLRRHQDALQTLRQIRNSPPSAGSTQAAVHALLARSMESPDATYRSYMEKITQENCKAFAILHNSTTPAQRRNVIATLQDYETDARALMLQKH